jgi:hypothetical protein
MAEPKYFRVAHWDRDPEVLPADLGGVEQWFGDVRERLKREPEILTRRNP